MERIGRASLLLVVAALLVSPALASTARTDPAAEAARWLATRQRASGDLPSYTGSGVGELVVALLSGGEAGEPVDRALSYLRTHGEEAARSPAHAGRIVMGLVAAGEDPRSPTDFVRRIEAGYDSTTGAYEENVYANALAALGHLAAGNNLPGRAVTYLRAQQCATGGFAWRVGCTGIADTDTTSLVLSALIASGLPSSDTTISRARTFLADVQNEDGGFGLEPGNPTNANSTGLALSAISALRERPDRGPWRRGPGADPVSALLGLQAPDGGFRYLATSSEPGDYATVQALPGLAGTSYPMPVVERAAPASAAPDAPAAEHAVDASEPPRAAGSPSPGRTHRAGVIVRGDDGREKTFCVAFDEPQITGEELLRRTKVGLEVSRTQLGSAVCSVEGTGCPSGDCFCRYPTFWGYWTLDPRAKGWTFSQQGAGARTVTDGSLDAWVWARDGKPPPPVATIEEVCAGEERGGSGDTASTPKRSPDETGREPTAAIASFAGLAAVLGGAGALVVWRRRRHSQGAPNGASRSQGAPNGASRTP